MPEHMCPWWGGFFIDNPLRRLLHNPTKILGPYVKPGMTVMEVGCGWGIFSIAMAKMVGDDGKVIAVDLQQKMLDVTMKRAQKAGVAHRIQPHRCEANDIGVDVTVDFALAFAMVHEVSLRRTLLEQIHCCLKPDGKFLVAEPRLHVSGKDFEKTVAIAEEVGLRACERPAVRLCRAVVLKRAQPTTSGGSSACESP
jgi:ubiquinone/menaquinone biosynthesis C-methylase UbiE